MATPRFKTTKWKGYDNFECLLCPFATLDAGLIVVHVREQHPTAAEVGAAAAHPLAGIPFASDEAAELALEQRLGPADFHGYTPTGKTGYVLDDVRRIAASGNRKQHGRADQPPTTEGSEDTAGPTDEAQEG